MIPKEKAIELYDKMYYATSRILSEKNKDKSAKASAIIAVDEILDEFPSGSINSIDAIRREYYLQVKQEIENL